MSKVTPDPYYICDYCGKKFNDYRDIKYTDSSGLNDQDYDMCSDECLDKHIRYLKKIAKEDELSEEEFKEYIEEFLPVAFDHISKEETTK
jgi:hypothetical protein